MVPNLAVIEELRHRGESEMLYIGSQDGPERKMVEKACVRFESVKCGKLRRWVSFQNVLDLFKVPVGIFQARGIMKKFGTDVVFSKGGYVSLPVVIAAKSLGVRVLAHESDVSVGLANKVGFKFATKILLGFEETKSYLSKSAAEKAVVVGSPVRREVLMGDSERGRKFAGFDKHRPVLLVMGGSQGAREVNELVWSSLDELLKKFQIVHIVGKGNINLAMYRRGYVQYEYLDEQMKDVYALCEIAISRGGANSLVELAALGKKVLVIPLGGVGSRGEQSENARVFARQYGWGVISGEISPDDFVKNVGMIYGNNVSGTKFENGLKKIVDLILKS